MPKLPPVRTKKRKFHGNRHTTKVKANSAEVRNTTASISKLSRNSSDYEEIDNDGLNGNRIIDISIFLNIIRLLCCPECFTASLHLQEDSRFGLCSYFTLRCSLCTFTKKFVSTEKVKRSLDINSRFVFAMRLIGKGISATKKLCSALNLPPPLQNSSFRRLQKKLFDAVAFVAKESMFTASTEVHDISQNKKRKTHAVTECGVSVDGTWQRRGYSSLNGCVAAMSIQNGKVLDIEVLSKYCSVCTKIDKMERGLEYELRKAEHNCSSNYKGTASGMEAVGAYRIFERSIKLHKLKYTEYYGDGDSKSYVTVKDMYGKDTVTKLECIGHVQKRVGSRLRKLKNSIPGLKGKGKLTDNFIDKLQNYYGIAIRSNVGNLSGMQQAVMAALFHCSSSTSHPMHGQCPRGSSSWCKHQRSIAENTEVKNTTGIPTDILNKIKPSYMELCDQELLQKCLHGKTQNANESFNGILWQIIPKENFVTLQTLLVGANISVILFNDGFKGLLPVFRKLGMNSGHYTLQGFKKLDNLRINDSKRHSLPSAKLQRKKLRAIRKRRKDINEQKEGITYKAGEF